MHHCQRAFEIRLVQVRVIGAELIGQEHALVDDRAARDRHRVIAGKPPLDLPVDRGRDRLAQDVEAALELVLCKLLFPLSNENLHVEGFSRLHGVAKCRIVDRHVAAPAEDRQTFVGCDLLENLAHLLTALGVARHEQHADAVFAGRRQRDAEILGLARKKLVRNLRQNAGAVAGARIGADRAAVFEVAEDLQRIFDDLMRLAALDVGDEADAAGILVEARIVHALHVGHAGIGAVAIEQARVNRRAHRGAFAAHALAIAVFTHRRRSHAPASPGHPRRRHTFHASSAGEHWPKQSSIEGSLLAVARRHPAPPIIFSAV
jgi:hypothetical protein